MADTTRAGEQAAPAPRFHIRTLGCKVNRAESDKIAASLVRRGWQSSDAPEADLCIVNTCTVTGEADAKNRKAVRQLLKACAGPVVVTGCAVNVGEDFYRALDARVTVVRDKDAVCALAEELAGARASAAGGAAVNGDAALGGRTRAAVKVQDGCDNSCSFCIVHTARGPARSVPAQDVVAEVRERFCRAPELVLVGIDLAAYRDAGTDLAGLLRVLQERTEVGRIRITSVEPQSLSPSLAGQIAASGGRVCRHLHLCLQSGSTKVLREMNRNYTAEQFASLVEGLRATVPGIALSTDVIVGFPGETDDDFARTCELVERCGFMRLHVFRYSKRPGTPAAERADQVPAQTAAQRAAQLAQLGRKLAAADRAARVGTRELVVVERPGRGTSESYHEVRFADDVPLGALVEMQFTGTDDAHEALVGVPTRRDAWTPPTCAR